MTKDARLADRLTFADNGVRNPAPTLVLIHGAGGQARDWPVEWRYKMNAAQTLGVRALPPIGPLASHRVISIDLPGHGAAAGPAHTSVDGYALAVKAFLEHEGIDRAVLVGHSMGGAIALTTALAASHHVQGIVVLGSAARLGVTPEILEGLQSAFEATVNMIVKFSWSRSAPAVYRETGRRHMLAAGPETVLADFQACASYSVKDRLAELSCPVLVVAGGSDKMVPPKASRSLAEGVKHGRYVEIEGAGHFLHFEQTKAVAGEVTAFLQSL